MASWTDLVNVIRNGYEVTVDEPDHLGLCVALDRSRSQTVHVWRHTVVGGAEDWVQIESPFGRIGEGDAISALRQVGDMVCGGVATLGDLLVLRHSVPLANVDTSEFDVPLRLVLSSADRLLQQYADGGTLAAPDGSQRSERAAEYDDERSLRPQEA